MPHNEPADHGTDTKICVSLFPFGDGCGSSDWLGAPSRLTGDADPISPIYRAVIGQEEARGDAEWTWQGRSIICAANRKGMARGLILNFMDIDAQVIEEFHDWYSTEHLPRLAALQGVLRAERFGTVDGAAPAWLALYEMEDIGISQSADWMVAARTPWSDRMRQFVRNYRRLAFWRGLADQAAPNSVK